MPVSSRWLFPPAARRPFWPPPPPAPASPPPCALLVPPPAGPPCPPPFAGTPSLLAAVAAEPIRPAVVARTLSLMPYFEYSVWRSLSVKSGLKRNAPLGTLTALLAQATG